MSNKLIFGIGLVIGGALGVVATRNHFKTKYDEIAKEEINSILKKYEKNPADDEPVDKEKKVAKKTKVRDLKFSKKDRDEAKKIVRENRYSEATEDSDKPYVIPPEEYGYLEGEGYESISLTYYVDGVLAEGRDIVDDIEGTIGLTSLNHFGEYEEDSVFVRNDRLKTDFEILLDQRTYEESLQ